MRLLAAAILAAASTASALVVSPQQVYLVQPEEDRQQSVQVEEYLVETAPGISRWVTDEGKLDLIRARGPLASGYG